MVSLITQNTMIDAFESKEYIRVLLYKNEYRIYYKDVSVELVKGKGVNNPYRYEAFNMANKIAVEECLTRRRK